MTTEFRLPDLGENITSGTVTKILVSIGETVSQTQAILEIETNKAVVEVPSNVTGVVKEIKVTIGKSISVGDVVLLLEPNAAEAQQVLPKPTSTKQPKPTAPIPEPVPITPTLSPKEAVLRTLAPAGLALASPSVRRFAYELGVDIDSIQGSGLGGRVSLDDVRAFIAHASSPPKSETAKPIDKSNQEPIPSGAETDRWGAIERAPMNAIRLKTASHLLDSWRTIPHVTHFDAADITSLETFRKQYAPKFEKRGGRLTVTAILIKIVAAALRKFPQFNASVDMEGQAIVFKKYVNIGVAVDTKNGLLVPVIRNVDTKSLLDLSIEIPALAEKARLRKLTIEEMSGGTFTITNLGGIGGSGFTPIINAPEVAILGVSRSKVEPIFQNGAFAPRIMIPLSLSYDHRIIDGADAARFTRWVAEALEQPFVLMLNDLEA
jgi:pyruvate dehydrogenase E2 component (dihydrolipoamide acetyltransferase)